MTNKTGRRLGGLFAVGLAIMATLVAGCVSPGGADEKAENKAPEASLTANRNTGWTGESFQFDARESKDPDGEIREWRFDFGDGTSMVVSREDDARVTHTYMEGGEYTVTVTVIDDGKEQSGSQSDTATKTVAVNLKQPVAQQVLYAAPANNSAVKGTFSQPFKATDDADRFEASIDLRNTLAAGSSVITVKILDPDGDVLDEEKVTLPGNGEKTVDLSGNLYDQGEHKLEISADDGGATAQGELRVYYDRGYVQD